MKTELHCRIKKYSRKVHDSGCERQNEYFVTYRKKVRDEICANVYYAECGCFVRYDEKEHRKSYDGDREGFFVKAAAHQIIVL